MHVSFLSTANFLVTLFVKSERALFDKYDSLGTSTDVKLFDIHATFIPIGNFLTNYDVICKRLKHVLIHSIVRKRKKMRAT